MPATTQDYSQIKKYQEQAASTQSAGKALEASSYTLGDQVMEAVRADRTTRGVSKLATDVGNVMGQMVTDPTGIRERTSGMVDPFSVNNLTSGARAQNLRTLGTVSTQMNLNQQPIDEVIQAGANQLKQRAAMLYAQAEQEANKAASLQSEWERAFSERQQDWKEYMDKQGSGGGVDWGSMFGDKFSDGGASAEDGFVEDAPTQGSNDPTFSFTEAIGALAPKWATDTKGWATDKAIGAAKSTAVPLAMKLLSAIMKKNKGGK